MANLKNIALRWTFLVIVFILIEIYAFQAFKTAFKNNWSLKTYFIINALIIFNLIFRLIIINKNSLSFSDVFYNYLSIPFAFFITLFGFKLIVISFLFIEDIIRMIYSIFNFFISSNDSNKFFLQRRNFVSKIALIIAALPIPFVIHGIYRGRHNYKSTFPNRRNN